MNVIPTTARRLRRALALLGGLLALAPAAGAQNVPLLVKDINPTASPTTGAGNSSSPQRFMASGSYVYFSADDGTADFELWRSNGTAAGTIRLKDIYTPEPPPASQTRFTSNPTPLYANGILYFSAMDNTHGYELWKTNGTAAGTVMIRDVNPGAGYFVVLSPWARLGSVNYFLADDGVHGCELWRSDGTAAGTRLALDYYPGSKGFTNPGNLLSNGKALFFTANGEKELWKSNGTSVAGTLQLTKAGAAGPYGQYGALNPVSMGGTVYFRAWDLLHNYELWKTDGTVAGTVRLTDINAGMAESIPASNVWMPASDGKMLFFFANDGKNGLGLYQTDGTTTKRLKTLLPGYSGASMQTAWATIRNVVYFAGTDSTRGAELWKSDGTAAGTALVRNIATAADNSDPQFLTALDGKVYFAATNAAAGRELWVSDGTSAGTLLAGDITPGPGSSNPLDLTLAGNYLFFSAENSALSQGRELWALPIVRNAVADWRLYGE